MGSLKRNTSFTAAAYGSHQNVFIRMDPLGRPPSANSGSYATIASLNKFPLSESKKSWFRRTPSPSLYATALLPLSHPTCESVYANPESVCPSRISYYASSQLTQSLIGTFHTLYSGPTLDLECHSPTWFTENNVTTGYVKKPKDCCVKLNLKAVDSHTFFDYTTELMNECLGPPGFGEMKIIAEVTTRETGPCKLVSVCADTSSGLLVQCREKARRTKRLSHELKKEFERTLGHGVTLPAFKPVPSDDCADNTNCP